MIDDCNLQQLPNGDAQPGPRFIPMDCTAELSGHLGLGKHTLNVGGLLTIQDGAAWGRGEQVEADSADNPIGSVYIPLEKNGERRLDGFYDLNLTLAWGFPIWSDKVQGNLRIEGTNVTNQQDQINTNLYGEPLRVRREFQRPSTYRAMFGVSF
jgi:hypothetical protein